MQIIRKHVYEKPHKQVMDLVKIFSNAIATINTDYNTILNTIKKDKNLYSKEGIQDEIQTSLEDYDFLINLQDTLQEMLLSSYTLNHTGNPKEIHKARAKINKIKEYYTPANTQISKNIIKILCNVEQYSSKIQQCILGFFSKDKEIGGLFEQSKNHNDISEEEYKRKLLKKDAANLSEIGKNKIGIEPNHHNSCVGEYRKLVLGNKYFYNDFIIANKQNILNNFFEEEKDPHEDNKQDNTEQNSEYILFEEQIKRLENLYQPFIGDYKHDQRIIGIESSEKEIQIVKHSFENISYCIALNSILDGKTIGTPGYGTVVVKDKEYDIYTANFSADTYQHFDIMLRSKNTKEYPHILLDFTYLRSKSILFQNKINRAERRNKQSNEYNTILDIISINQYKNIFQIVEQNIMNYIQGKEYSFKIDNKAKYPIKRALEDIINEDRHAEK